MKLQRLAIFSLMLAMSCGSNAQSNEKSVDLLKGMKRWGSIPIAQEEVFLAIPEGFPLSPSGELHTPGLYRVWFYPDGQTKENWKEVLRLMVFSSTPTGNNTPTKLMLAAISQPIKAACPNDFILEPKVQRENNRASVIMGCRKIGGGTPASVFGYYLAIQSAERIYVVAREFRQRPFEGELPIAKSTQSQWQEQTDRTTVCRRNEICFK